MCWIKKLITVLLILAGIGSVLLTACSPESQIKPTPTLAGAEVDPAFREFYNRLGGQVVLGLALQPADEKDGILSQYTEGGLMIYNPKLLDVQKYSLAPLGVSLIIQPKKSDLPSQEGAVVINGYVVYSKFVDLYEIFDMTRYAGNPLSQPMADADTGQIIQYFENVGFYTSLSDPKDSVHLIPYGQIDCVKHCQKSTGTAKPLVQPVYDEPFLDSLNRIGLDLAGRPLSAYYRTSDGMIEQVYENVVIDAPAANLRLVSLRPLPDLAGFPPGPLAVKNPANGLVFIPLDHNLGHNVAQVFEQYIANHGGGTFAGPPTSEMFTQGSLYRQCFTNYCLDYDPSLPVDARIHPSALGKIYLQNNPPNQPAIKALTLSPETVQLQSAEKKTAITMAEKQVITLTVLQRQDQSPLPNLTATLTITLPDGQILSYSFGATDSQGISQVTIEPIAAANGTIIPYEVCLNLSAGTPPICTTDTFAIWTP